MLRFGNVAEADYERGTYRVEFHEDGIISFPFPRVAFITDQVKAHLPIPVGTFVACLVSCNGLEGVVLGPVPQDGNRPPGGGAEDNALLTYEGGLAIEATADSLSAEVETTALEVTAAGIRIARAAETLSAVLDDLAAAVRDLAPISAAPGSPCAPNPVDVTKMELIAARITNILN